jgi:hypothetical protein
MVGPGNLSLQSVANYNLDSITQTDASFPEVNHVGYDSCDLQIECQRYEYRLFTDVSYAQGPWNMSSAATRATSCSRHRAATRLPKGTE